MSWHAIRFSIHFTGCFQGRREKNNSKKERLWQHMPDLTPAYIPLARQAALAPFVQLLAVTGSPTLTHLPPDLSAKIQ